MVLLLFAVAATATYGQQGAEVPRLTPEEQAALEKSVQVNPARLPAASIPDTRMEVKEDQVTQNRWKIEETRDDVREVPATERKDLQKPAGQDSAPLKEQPQGLSPQGKTVNLRTLNGPKTQTLAPAPVRVTSLRDQKGDKSQPEGEKPSR